MLTAFIVKALSQQILHIGKEANAKRSQFFPS